MGTLFSTIFPDLYLRRAVVVIFLTAFFLRLGIFLYLFLSQGVDGLSWVDANQYKVLATNLVSGNGYSSSVNPPYALHTLRTPGYPLFLAFFYFISGDFWPASLAAAVLNSFVPVFVFWLAWKTSNNPKIAATAGFLTAVDYHLAVYTLTLNTESIFVFIAVLSAIFIYKYVERPDFKKAVVIGFLSGYAALTRPFFYYALPLIFVFLIFSLKGINIKKRLAGALCFLFMASALVFPWMHRNKQIDGVFTLSSLGWFNMYARVAVAVEAAVNHQSFGDAYSGLFERLKEEGIIKEAAEYELHEAKFIPFMREQSLAIFREHPKETLLLQLISIQALFTHDDLLYILNHARVLPDAERPPIPLAHLLLQKGPYDALKDIYPYLKGSYLIPYIMRVVWIIFWILSIWGAWHLLRTGDSRQRAMSWFIIGLILFMVAVSLPVSASLNARYRLPFEPFYFILVASGAAAAYARMKLRFFRDNTHNTAAS